MTDLSRSRAWLCLAVVYFTIAVALGIAMGVSGNHSLFPVHAHLNLLGWVSMALFGAIGTLYPATLQGRVATCQFWLYNLGVPVMLAALAFELKGNPQAGPVLGIASLVVGVAVLLYAVQVLRCLAGAAPGQDRMADGPIRQPAA